VSGTRFVLTQKRRNLREDLKSSFWPAPGVLPQATREQIVELGQLLGVTNTLTTEWPGARPLETEADPMDLAKGANWPKRATIGPGVIRHALLEHAISYEVLGSNSASHGARSNARLWADDVAMLSSGTLLWGSGNSRLLTALAKVHMGSYCIMWNADSLSVSILPKEVHMRMNRFHSLDGPAIVTVEKEYYYMDGTAAEKWMIDGDCTAEQILGIKNVNLRSRVIEHLGIERVLSEGTLVEEDSMTTHDGKVHSYSLHHIIVSGRWARRRDVYLKMENPSTGDVHVESVPRNITTVMNALAWRNNSREVPRWLA